MTETLAHVYSSESTQQELSLNEYQHGRVYIVIKTFGIFVLWTKVASPLKELNKCQI